MPVVGSPDFPGNIALASSKFKSDPVCAISEQQGNDATDEGGALELSDRLLSVDVSFSVDQPMGAATVRMALGKGGDSLSPLISTSPTIGSNKAIRPHNLISLGFNINDNYQYEVLTGRIDRINVAESLGVVSMTCRDWGAYIQEAAIRDTAMFGLAGGKLAENVMRDILAANGWSQYQLDAVGVSDFMIYPYPVGQVGTLDALRTIAQQIGWDVRWFPNGWRNRPGGPLVHLYNPSPSIEFDIHGNRFVQVPDAFFDKRRYSQLQEVAWGDEDVRNDWDIYYQDPTTGLPVGPVHVESAESIALYSRRKAMIYLQRAENIRDNDAALRFGKSALADNQDPFVSHKLRGPLYPNVTLNDVHTYLANDLEYDTDLTLAVVGYQHHWESTPNTMPWTVIAARGKPLAAYRDYRRSIPPKVIVTTAAPTTEFAPEGTMIFVTDSLAPP